MKKITIIIKALAFTVLFITSNINGQNTALNFEGTPGANGAAISGQLVFTSSMIPLTNSFTVMGWVDVNAANTQIFTWGSGTVNKYILINTSFDQKIQIFSPLGVISLKSTTTIGGSWHHVAITNNSGAITIYVDGVSEATGTADFSSITPTQTSFGTAFINGIYQGSGNYDIDEFSIWSIALSGAQILTFKDTPPSGGESGLVAAYNFNPAGVTPGGDNTSLTTLNDLTGNYPGTLFGFPLMGSTGNYITSTNATLGVNDVKANLQRSLYPNPVSNNLYITGVNQKISYSIYNVLGIKVLSSVVGNNEKINVKSLVKGLYFLNFEDQQTLKFIKN